MQAVKRGEIELVLIKQQAQKNRPEPVFLYRYEIKQLVL